MAFCHSASRRVRDRVPAGHADVVHENIDATERSNRLLCNDPLDSLGCSDVGDDVENAIGRASQLAERLGRFVEPFGPTCAYRRSIPYQCRGARQPKPPAGTGHDRHFVGELKIHVSGRRGRSSRSASSRTG